MKSSINKISLDSKSLFNKFSHGLILNILLKIKGLIYIPILVNFISKEDLGEISYVKAFVGLLTGMMFLNIPDSANRLILKNKDFNIQLRHINTFTNFCFLFGISFLLFFIFISIKFDLIDLRILLVATALLFTALIDKLSKYVFQIFQNTKLLTIVILSTEYISLFVVCLVLYYGIHDDILLILYIYALSLALSSTYLFYKLFKTYTYEWIIDFSYIKKVLKISLYLFPASYSMMIVQSSDFIIIENYLSLNELGEYSFSYSLAGIVSGLSMAVTFFWYSSAVYASKSQIERLIYKILKIALFGLLLLIICYYFLTGYLIELINPDYSNSYDIIMILIVGFFIGILNQIYQGVMYADGKEKLILLDSSIIAVLNIILNLLFIPKYGLKFAAFSTSLSFLILFILRTYYVNKKYLKTKLEPVLLYSYSIFTISLTTIIYYLWI